MANEIYNFLKQNNLTQKSEQDFIKEYSNPDKAKELHGFLQQNNLTKKDSAQFYNEYFKPQTIQQPTQTTTNGIGVLKKQLPFKAVTDFQQSIVDLAVPNKNTENNPIIGIGTPMEKKKQEPKLEMVYSATEKQLVPKYTEAPKTSVYDVANAMSTEQLLTANNDVLKGVVSQANGDTGLDEFNQQSDKNNNIQAFNRESELYNVRVKTLKERAGNLERVLASKYQTPDFMEQVKSQMATVKQKSQQYDAYVQSRSKEVIALQTELEAIVEQGKAGTQPIEVLKPAYDAKKAQLDAIQRDDEQKRSEIEQLQNDFNGKLDDPDFALYSQIYDKINELSGEQQGLISKPEFAEYRKLLDEGDKAQAKKDAMKKAYQSKGILGKAVDIYAGIGMATNPAAYFLDNGEQVDKTFTGAKIADEGDKLLGRTLKALASVPKMLDISNPIGDENKYDVFDEMFDQAVMFSKKRDILNPTATDVQRDIIQKYADVDGYRVMLDENGKPTNDVRDASFYKVNDKTQKEITDKYNENPTAYKTEKDFSASTLTTKATPTILDMGTMMATAMLSGGTTGLLAGAGTAGTVSTATTVGVSAAQMYGDMYESGLNAGLTPQEANDFATLTSIMTGMVTLVNPMEANIVKGTASKSIGKFISNSISKADVQLIRSGEMSIGQYAKRMAKEGVKNTFGENLEELVLEPAVQRATETYYNTKAQKNGQQGFEDLNKPFFDTKQTIETAMITTMASLLMTPIEVANSVPEQRKIALQNALDNPQQFLDIRQKMLEDGDIEKGKFDYEVKAFEEISKQYNTVKPNIKEDLHDDLAELLLKKYTLKNTMSQVNDEVLNRKNQLLLDDINKRLEEVADGTYNKGKEKALSNIANPNTLIEEDKIATYNGAEVTILDDLADGEVVINTNNPEIGEDGIITVEKSSLTDVRNKPKDIEQLQITSAVININGKEYEGKNHAEAILKAQADGQDISQVNRQSEGLFKLSDGTIINREQAKEQFGQDRSELIIPQDEVSNQANVEYKRIQDEQKNPITPVEPINTGQEVNNGAGIQQVNGNGGEIQQGDGIGQVSGQEVPTEKVEEGVIEKTQPIKSSFESNIEALINPETGLGATVKKIAEEQKPYKLAFLERMGLTLDDYSKLDDTKKQEIQDEWVKSKEFEELAKLPTPEVSKPISEIAKTPISKTETTKEGSVGVGVDVGSKSILKSDVDLKGDKKKSWMRKNSLDKISVNDINEEGHNNNLSSAKENVKAGKKSQTKEAPLVEIDENGNATIIDGHHRIAEDILDGKSHIEAVVDNKFNIRDAIKDGLYEKAISEGRMTAKDAKEIIESAGLKIPKSVEESLKETPKTETTEQKLKNDKHDRMVGLMREYNSTPTNKKTRKSEIRQSINKLASDLGYTVKGKTGDKIDILNAKGKVIRKINITSDEVTVTPEVIEKTKELAQGWFEWNGNELDYHIDASQLGLTWQEIRRAKADIDAGKTESTNINRVANAINEYGNMESLPLVRGFGGNYERIDVTGEDLFWANKVSKQQTAKSFTPIDKTAFEKLLDKLKKAFPNVKVELFGKGNMESAKKALEKYGVDLDLQSIYNIIGLSVLATSSTSQINQQPLITNAVSDNLNLSDGNVVEINDNRLIDKASGNKITDKNKMSASVTEGDIKKLTLLSNKHGVDPYTMIAMTMQETNFDTGLENPFHYDPQNWEKYKGISEDPMEIAVLVFKDKLKYAERLGKKTEAEKIQAYNGYGKIGKKTDAQKGSSVRSWYGISSSSFPIDMNKTPIYGNRVLDIRDNIIKSNPKIVKLVESQSNNIAFLKTKDGTIYGFKTPDGKVFINTDNLNANTPIHEFGHIWQSVFPQEFARGIELLKLSPQGQALIREIQKNPAYKGKTISEIQAEALVTAIGNKGEQLFNSNPTLFNKFKEWLSDFFKKLGDKLGIKDLSADDKLNIFTKKVTGELLGGKELSKNIGESSDIDLQMDKAIKQSKDIQLKYNTKGQHLAPNGKPSNLTEQQAKIVRTDAFKNWFGDWDNDAKNASSVIDENGEPLVVYHGSYNIFNEFSKEKRGINTESDLSKLGFFFSSSKEVAGSYATENAILQKKAISEEKTTREKILEITGDDWYYAQGKFEDEEYSKDVMDKITPLFEINKKAGDFIEEFEDDTPFSSFENKGLASGAKVYEVFLNIRKPLTINERNVVEKEESVIKNLTENKNIDGVIIPNTMDVGDISFIDGEVESDIYIALNPNQIKLADGTNTTFNPESNDIRFQIANNPSKEEIGRAYDKAQQYLEATDFDFDADQRDAFIEEIKQNTALKAMFTTSQLEKIYEAQPLNAVDKVKIKYKLLVYNLKANNSANKAGLKQQQKQMVADITALIKGNLGGITGKQAERLTNLATTAVEKNSTVRLGKIINQIANLADQRTYQKAKTLYEIIKARSKRKGGVQSGKLTGVLQDFATINPLDVSDIAKYVELAEKVKQASNVVKQPTDADSDLVYDEVQAYVKAQQDEINSNAINDTLEDDAMTFFTVLDNKTKAKFGDDKTFDDLNEVQQREVFESITKDDIKKYGLTDEERDMVEAFKEIKTEQKRQDFITETYVKIGELKDLLVNSVGVITQSPAEKEITDALLNVKLDDMTATEMARVLKLINGITQNNDYSGGGVFVAQQKAVEVLIKTKALSDKIGGFRSLTKRVSFVRNFQQIGVAMAKGKALGAQLMEVTGVNEILRGIAKTKTYANDNLIAFKEQKFDDSVYEPISQMRQSIYAAVIQTKIGDDVKEAEHIERWKNIIESNIKNLRAKDESEFTEQADMLQKALDEVIGNRQQLKDIADNMSKIDSEGKRVVLFFIDNHAEQKPRFRENSLLVHNEEIEEYNNYTKLSVISIDKEPMNKNGDDLLEIKTTKAISKKKSKSMIDRQSYEELGKDAGLDFNFINRQFKALSDNEYDINTSANIETAKLLFNRSNDSLKEILGSKNWKIFKNKLQFILSAQQYREPQIIDDIVNELAQTSRAIALGSVTQAIKQATVLISTVANAQSLDFTLFGLDKTKKENINKLLKLSEIGARRSEGAGGIYDTTNIDKKISDNVAQGIIKTIRRGKGKLTGISMYTLRATDVKVADVSWITYYKKYLKDNGLKFDDRFEHRNPNKDALAYAESMTQTTQGANTEAGQAQIWEDWKNTAKIFLPYMSFSLQAKVRLYDNVANVFTGKNKKEAGIDIGGFLVEQTAFNLIKYGISYFIVRGAIDLIKGALGFEDDDTELDRIRKAEQARESFYSNAVKDATYGTLPILDDQSQRLMNYFFKKATKTNVDMIPVYNNPRTDVFKSGTLGALWMQKENATNAWDIIKGNKTFGDYSYTKSVTKYRYKGEEYIIVHGNGYAKMGDFTKINGVPVSNGGYVNDKKAKKVTDEILKAFTETPRKFDVVEELRADETESKDRNLELELTDNQKAYAVFIFATNIASMAGLNETLINQINTGVQREMMKQTPKKQIIKK